MLVEHTTISGKYGLPNNGRIHYDNNGVIRLVIIDPGGDGNWMDNNFSMDIESDKRRHIGQPGQLQGHGEGYRRGAGRFLQQVECQADGGLRAQRGQ